MSNFSERIRERRMLTGLTQKQLGEKAGLTERGYRYFESGEQEPTLSKAAAIARALGVSLDYLAGLQDDSTI